MAHKSHKYKVDNHSLASKVAIRRWLIERLGLKDVRVLDTCTGAGHIWSELEKLVNIRQWTKIDKKPRMGGTLRMDATEAIRVMPLDEFDIIDIDTYGEPWNPYFTLLARYATEGRRPLGVVLTHGFNRDSVSYETLARLGIPDGWPVGSGSTFFMDQSFVQEECLAQTWKYARIAHAGRIAYRTSNPSNNGGPSGVVYYALALEPLYEWSDEQKQASDGVQ